MERLTRSKKLLLKEKLTPLSPHDLPPPFPDSSPVYDLENKQLLENIMRMLEHESARKRALVTAHTRDDHGNILGTDAIKPGEKEEISRAAKTVARERAKERKGTIALIHQVEAYLKKNR